MKTFYRLFPAIFIAIAYCSPAIANENFSEDLKKASIPLLWFFLLFVWLVSDFTKHILVMMRMSWLVKISASVVSVICASVLESLSDSFFLKLAILMVIAVALLAGAGWFVVRFIQLVWRWLRGKFTSLVENSVPVATTIMSASKAASTTSDDEYDPRHYFVKGKFFMGLSASGPMYHEGDLPHISFCGSTGTGKGVGIQTLALQSLVNDEALVVVDPKDDEYLSSVIKAGCEQYGKKYHYLNLAAGQPFQINLLEGANRYEIEEMFKSAAGLAETGKPSDFYLFADRFAARKIAEFCEEQQCTLSDCFAALGGSIEEDAPKMYGILRELAQAKCINAVRSQTSIAKVIENGEALYILGSLRDDSIKRIQRMLFVRIIQIAESRDRTYKTPRRICVVLDEAKHHLSRIAIEALQTARDKQLHCVLAYQSVGDLADVSADMSAESVKDAILQNCRVQYTYKVFGADTADWCSRNSGTKDISQEAVTYALGTVSTVEQRVSRTVRVAQAAFVEANEFLTLPKGQAILIGLGLPVRVQMSPIKVQKDKLATQVVPAEGPQAALHADEVL